MYPNVEFDGGGKKSIERDITLNFEMLQAVKVRNHALRVALAIAIAKQYNTQEQ